MQIYNNLAITSKFFIDIWFFVLKYLIIRLLPVYSIVKYTFRFRFNQNHQILLVYKYVVYLQIQKMRLNRKK